MIKLLIGLDSFKYFLGFTTTFDGVIYYKNGLIRYLLFKPYGHTKAHFIATNDNDKHWDFYR